MRDFQRNHHQLPGGQATTTTARAPRGWCQNPSKTAYDHPMMPSAAALTLYALAVARITTLITHDEVTAPARLWLIRHFDHHSQVHRLVTYALGAPDDDAAGCPWCVSIWVGLSTAPLLWFWADSPWVMVPALGFAASQATGMIYSHGRS